METGSPETRKGTVALPFLGTFPSTKGRSCPTGPLTNPARVGCRHFIFISDRWDFLLHAFLYVLKKRLEMVT